MQLLWWHIEHPKTFLWQCDGDDLVPFANSQLLAEALEKNNVPYCYEVFHYPIHGLREDADEYARSWLERAVNFWGGELTMQKNKIDNWLQELSLEEKCMLLTGGGALRTASNERLGIPRIEMSDGPHGIRRLLWHPIKEYEQVCNIEGGDTCFPTASAMGSSWNRELVKAAGAAIARDCRQEQVDLLLAPGINMKRTPVCGRNFEYYSEDPLLSGELGAAFIQGVQGEGVGTSLKHFAANNQEIDRSSISVEADERTLREYYLEAFRIAIEKGKPETVMCAYNKLCGIWCSENKWLLTELLKEEWGYEGLIVSDWHAVHNPAKALAAGLELQMPCNRNIYEEMKQGIEVGLVSEKEIDDACRHILEYVLFRISNRKKDVSYDRRLQHEAAYHAATEVITLLKNENKILPIKPEVYKGIVVFGNYAKEPVFMGGGSSKVTVEMSSVDSPLEYIKEFCEEKSSLFYEPLYPLTFKGDQRRLRIKELSEKADIAIVFAASEPNMEAEEYDRSRIAFSDYINESIQEVCQFFSDVIVVMQTGCCTVGNGWENSVKGLVQMWFAGESGGKAIADVLFGKVNPSGKLSETFMKEMPKHLDYPGNGKYVNYAEGMNCGYRYYDKHPQEVWYPFGHGLSYTEFAYSDLKITPEYSDNPMQTVTVSCKIQNTGDVAGKEVIQLYVEPADSIAMRPVKELKGFVKIFLEPGESKELSFTLDGHAFSYYNPYLHDWHVESGTYRILLGASSQDIRLKGEYSVAWSGDYTVDLKKKAIVL